MVGGTVAGILSGSSKREKTMQGNEPRGMFEQLSSGSVGGGGVGCGCGGFGGYPQLQAKGQLPEGKSNAARSAARSEARKPTRKRVSGNYASGGRERIPLVA